MEFRVQFHSSWKQIQTDGSFCYCSLTVTSVSTQCLYTTPLTTLMKNENFTKTLSQKITKRHVLKKKIRELQKKMKKEKQNESNQFTGRKAHYDCLLNAVPAPRVCELLESLKKNFSLLTIFCNNCLQNGGRAWFLFTHKDFSFCVKCRKLQFSLWFNNARRKPCELHCFNNPIIFPSCVIGLSSFRECTWLQAIYLWLHQQLAQWLLA